MSRDPGASRGAPDIAGNALRPAPGRVGTFASEQSIEPGRPHARGRRPAATCSNAAPWTVLAGGMAISWRLEFLCTAATAGFCAAACGIAGPSAAPDGGSPPSSRNLDVSLTGGGAGRVTSTPAGIDCPGPSVGTIQRLQRAPATGGVAQGSYGRVGRETSGSSPGRLFRGVGASTADRSRGSDATGPRSLTRGVSGKEGNRVDVIFLIRRSPVEAT